MRRRRRLEAVLLLGAVGMLGVIVMLRHNAEQITPEMPAVQAAAPAARIYTADAEAHAPETPEPTPTPKPESVHVDADAVYLAQCLWGEARGVPSRTEQAAVAWCVLNRVAHPDFPDTVYGVLSSPGQFAGFSTDYPVDAALLALAQDVLDRWTRECRGEMGVGRVLPEDYLWFSSDGHGHNAFRNRFLDAACWDWSLCSPYQD